MSLAVERIMGGRDSDEALGQFLLTLRTRGFRTPRLLTAVECAPRTEFVAPEHVGFAYHDMSLPLPCGQEMGRPFAIIESVMALGLQPGHSVLEIGTGSGWQTALIAGLSRAVASIERWATLAETADERLQALGFTNAVVAHGDGQHGLPSAGPFDRIILNAAIAASPDALAGQLAEGGVILAPVATVRGQVMTRFTRTADGFVEERLGPAHAPLMASGEPDNL